MVAEERVFRALESLAKELPLEDKEFWSRLERRTGCRVETAYELPYPSIARVQGSVAVGRADSLYIVLQCGGKDVRVHVFDFVYVYSYQQNKKWILYYRV